MDIQHRMLISQIHSLQNENAHLRGKVADCVPREQYEAKCVENDMNVALLKEAEARIAKSEALIEDLERLLADANDTISRLKKKEFGPSSEIMDDVDDDDVRIPASHLDALACVAGLKLEIEKESRKAAKEPDSKEDRKNVRGGDRKKRKARTASGNEIGIYTKQVAEALGIDTTGMNPKAKLLLRGDGQDIWKFRVLFARWIKIYSKEYTIGRFYDPEKKDLVNSAYPAGIHDKCHLSPSFIAFYLRLKISYNVSEQNILRALEAAGCDIPQATLNKYIQDAGTAIREFLQDAMAEEIKESRFTHNDETRLMVKCPDKKTGVVGYRNEYIHGILSPSARILLLLYDDGSRKHDVQEEIMRDSRIECFTCDRAKMYPKIVKDIVNALDKQIIRAGCWVHWRRDVYELAKYDSRFKPILKALKILFRLEKKWREDGIGEQERLDRRRDLSRPIVDCIFSALKNMKADARDYGDEAMAVINYLLNDEDAFRAFLKHGLIEIDNNAIERCFRHIAMGRGTWLFTGSHKGAENLAFMYSLEESCRMNGLDFGTYIEYVMERMVAGEKDARSLLPNRVSIPSDLVPESQVDCPRQEKTA
ncbi:MAG: IS66 family transposase [Muribaculaceae bacterium]|nr:IS66 family transposase [Muribaculaceae bacterium]